MRYCDHYFLDHIGHSSHYVAPCPLDLHCEDNGSVVSTCPQQTPIYDYIPDLWAVPS